MVDQNTPPELLSAIELFYFAYRAFTEQPDRVLADRGLGRVHHRILYFVGRRPGIPVSALLETLRVSKQALNAPLRELMELELIASRVAAHDRRVKELTLTTEGKRLERQLTATQVRQLTAVFESAGASAAQGWQAVMRGVAELDGGNKSSAAR